MSKRAKRLLSFLVLLVVLPFIWLFVVKHDWLPVPTKEQVLARQRFEKEPRPSDGGNAIVLGELLRFSVPKSQWRRWAEYGPIGLIEALRAEGYEPLSLPDECSKSGERCLAEAVKNPASFRHIIDMTALQRSQLDEFHASTHAHLDASDPRYSVDQEMPHLGIASSLAQLEVVARFLGVDSQGAIQFACVDAEFWRRISFNTNGLINRLIGLKSLIRSGQILNALLVRSGPSISVSTDCLAAFEPLTPQQHDICDLMGTEYWALRGMLKDARPKERWYFPRWDSEYAKGRIAKNLLGDCEGESRPGSVANNLLFDSDERACSVVESVFDPVGCLAIDPSNHYGKYRRRMADHSVTLSALRSALAVNNRLSDESLQAAFQNRPDGDLRERQRMEATDNGQVVLTMEAGSYEPDYRFEPLPLRADSSAEQSVE